MKRNYYCIKLLLILLLSSTAIIQCRGQSYGLAFYSHDLLAEKRTSLDLFPDTSFSSSGSFQFSFDLSFLPGKQDYFGYIFRITENGKRNIDLIYNKRYLIPDLPDADHNHFKLVMDGRFSRIAFDIPQVQLINQWNKINLIFDLDHDELILYVNQKKFIEKGVKLKKQTNYKFLFGVNNYEEFKTNDVPPIKIRDVKIIAENKTRFYWPLNEASGDVVHEVVNNNNGHVNNPFWIRSLHRNWHFMKSMRVNGIASVAFNATDALLYINGKDSLWKYSVKDFKQSVVGYPPGGFNLLPSNQTAYNSYDHTLYNYYLDRNHKNIAVFNFKSGIWGQNFSYTPSIDYWQSNNFFSAADSSLYIIGGYGQSTYSNKVYRYHLPTKELKAIVTNGDFYCPRYLAACGTTSDGSAAYLLGGYGSVSGQQMLNPKNLYDLIKYDVKTKSFKKIYELKNNGEDFAFANNMIIDEKTQTFTALIFPNHVSNSNLQLLVGSLKNPSYQIIGSEIPYRFYDNHSFANLFYSPQTHQLIAVTLFRADDNNSTINIYSLDSPPDMQPLASVQVVPGSSFRYFLAAIIAIGLIVLIAYFFNLKKSRRKIKHQKEAALPDIHGPLVYDALSADSKELKYPSILLFGDLKLYTLAGEDITGHFTPLVKELFIAIIIFSLKSRRGISPEKLIELLWSDKSESSAKNNRSANLSKLKTLLNQMQNVSLTKDTGNWKIEIDFNSVYTDYYHYLQITSNRKSINKEQILRLIDITQRGSFLPSADYPWLDQIKSDVSNETIDIYLQYASGIALENDPEFLIKLANCIFNFDPVNEEAMVIKCRALSLLGKHSLAKSTLQTFNKEYMALYGEEFKRDFHSIVEPTNPK